MSNRINRREAISVFGAAAIGAGLTSSAQAQSNSPARKRVVRIAHLTDIHVQPERHANEGMIACIHHVQSLDDKPDMILTGGDHVMDTFEQRDDRTKLQWGLYHAILQAECSIPTRGCIGNHDIWGWAKSKSGCTGDEPNYGKKRATDMLSLNERYSSFDLTGRSGRKWHCVMLDSTQPSDDEGYKAYLDEAQFDWLERDLAAVPAKTPVLVLSHIPIVSAMTGLYARRDERGDSNLSGSLAHIDAVKIKNLFAKHPNVKLCLSGHLHHVERVDYNGVSYLCNGAVCGNWWKGKHHDCSEGYAVIDLFEDGSFETQYVTYGWNAKP